MSGKKVVIIGAGFGGLSAASYLAKDGFDVTVLEKNSWPGGRAQVWREKGYTFDLGPSWYWVPEVFEKFFNDFGRKGEDFYRLVRLDPSYRVYFKDECVDLPATRIKMCRLFEKYETGAGKKLETFLDKTEKVYRVSMEKFIPRAYSSHLNYLNRKTLWGGLQVLSQYNGFRPVRSNLRKFFKNEKLLKILEFPIYFLGESPTRIPSVYSIMNHVDIDQGTWYPIGGFGKVSEAFEEIAHNLGVKIIYNQEAIKVNVQDSTAVSVSTRGGKVYDADIIISNSDYYWTEKYLLEPKYGSYSEKYWQKRRLAPSAFLIHLGLNKKITGFLHHSLFFHHDWEDQNKALFEDKKWPENPLYYVACPSKTDPSIAPKTGDLLTILVPVASGLKDTKSLREKYFKMIIGDLEDKLSQKITDSIVVKKLYSLDDFTLDYHAYKGNAYGLAQTAGQTAIFRPSHRSKKVKNLYYAGQFTVPGIGVPMVILSGKIVADEISKKYGK